jgi:hypothetical protein
MERIYAFHTSDFGRPQKRDFADLTCISTFLINLKKFGFFNKLLNLEFSEPQTVREGKEQLTFH